MVRVTLSLPRCLNSQNNKLTGYGILSNPKKKSATLRYIIQRFYQRNVQKCMTYERRAFLPSTFVAGKFIFTDSNNESLRFELLFLSNLPLYLSAISLDVFAIACWTDSSIPDLRIFTQQLLYCVTLDCPSRTRENETISFFGYVPLFCLFLVNSGIAQGFGSSLWGRSGFCLCSLCVVKLLNMDKLRFWGFVLSSFVSSGTNGENDSLCRDDFT